MRNSLVNHGIRFLILLFVVGLFSCKAQHSYNSVEGKKKLKYYNSIQYDKKNYKK